MRHFFVVPMPQTGWLVYVGVPVAEMYESSRERVVTALAFALVAMGLLSLLAAAVARRIARPVDALEKAAQAVERGNLQVRAQVAGPREIAAVAQGFNTMIEAQQRNVQTLKSHLDELRVAATAFESQEGMMVTDADYRILRANHAMTVI